MGDHVFKHEPKGVILIQATTFHSVALWVPRQCTQSNSKSPSSLSQSQHNLTVQVSSETQGNLFTVNPCKSKSHISNLQWHRPCIQKGREVGQSEELPGQSNTKTQQGQLQSCSSMFHVKGLRWFCLPALLTTHFSLGLPTSCLQGCGGMGAGMGSPAREEAAATKQSLLHLSPFV